MYNIAFVSIRQIKMLIKLVSTIIVIATCQTVNDTVGRIENFVTGYQFIHALQYHQVFSSELYKTWFILNFIKDYFNLL